MTKHFSGAAASSLPKAQALELAGIWPRLMSIVYESLIVAAILFLATAMVLLVLQKAVPAGTLWFELYLLAVLAGYFGYCWQRSGQTIGMFSWRLLLTDVHGRRVSWGRALLRFVVATILGLGVLGLFWMWIDTESLALQDRLSGTRVVRLPRKT